MATETSKPELWQFCTVCDPHQERPFSVGRAYVKHLSSQRHQRRTNQPLDTFECPECGKHFSRESEVHRHLTNRRCSGTPGSRLITGPTTTSSKKHALSVSPNGVPSKIHRTATCTIDATVGLPPLFASRPTFRHNADQVVQAHNRTKAQMFVNRPLQRLVEDALPPRRTVTQLNKANSMTNLLLHNRNEQDTVQLLALSPTCPQDSINVETQASSALTDVVETEAHTTGACSAYDATSNKPTSDLGNTKSPGTPFATMKSGKELDQWLSDAMKSASLREDDLAHVHVRSVISSTPVASLSSLGSLFLLRTPKISTPRFSFPRTHLPKNLVRSFARSAEIPAPMLTELVEDGLCFAETSHTSVGMGTKSLNQGVSVVRPENVGQEPHLTRTASLPSGHAGVNDHTTTSRRSAKYSPSTSSYIHQLVTSAPDLVFQRAREVPYNARKDFFDNGQRLLLCAGTGDALGVYAILMKETLVDINYCGDLDTATYSSTRPTGTALMFAAGAGHHDVMYALLKASALRREYRLDLSICDRFGHTAIYLASQHVPGLIGRFPSCEGSSLPFRHFLRTLVAILCCDCPDKVHTGDDCDTVTYHREDMRPVLVLGLCRWCKRLSEPDWPGVNDVEEINKCVWEARAPMTDAKRAFLMTKDWVWLKDDQH
jgi:hypothetical protein